MNKEKRISIILPAYNEVDAIGVVLDKLVPMATERGWEVIVVDDGSNDGTGKVAGDFLLFIHFRPPQKNSMTHN